MANRLFYQFRLSLEKSIVDLFGKVTIGASGAPTLVTASSKGIASITKNSTGRYTIVLQDSYYGLLNGQIIIVNSTAPAAPNVRIVSEAVANAASKAIVIQFSIADGTATDPGSGEAFLMSFQLKNSSAY